MNFGTFGNPMDLTLMNPAQAAWGASPLAKAGISPSLSKFGACPTGFYEV